MSRGKAMKRRQSWQAEIVGAKRDWPFAPFHRIKVVLARGREGGPCLRAGAHRHMRCGEVVPEDVAKS